MKKDARKFNFEDVPDPFTLKEGTFEIHFPTFQVIPGRILSTQEINAIKKIIDVRLNLNDTICIDARRDWIKKYLKKGDMSFLEENAPFLAFELKRQQLDDINHPMWEEYKNDKKPKIT